jgi:hypothetical protein
MVAVLERLAKALDAKIVDLFVVPRPNEPAPKTLPSGRKRQRV